MTIPTKVEEKPKEAQVLINPETVVKVEFKQAVRDVAEKQQRRVHAAVNKLIQNRRRRYMAVTIAVAVASFLVVVAGICGGIWVYKWVFSLKRSSTQDGYFPQGSCVVPYHDDVRIEGYAQRQMQGRDEPSRALQSTTLRPRNGLVQPYGARGSFEERYSVINSDQEMLQVPQPGIGAFDAAPMTIIHDFTFKLTAIVDSWNERCYIKPLDPSVVPPRDLVDLIRRISDGSYVPNVCLIRKHYRPDPVPLDMKGLSALGSTMVFASCAQYTTYRLVPINAPTVTSTLPPATTPTVLSELIEDEDEEYLPAEDMHDIDETYQEEEDVLRSEEDVLRSEEDVLRYVEPKADVYIRRTKRSVDQNAAPVPSINSQVPDEDALIDQSDIVLTQAITDANDLVFNVGFAGSETVELAVVHFE